MLISTTTTMTRKHRNGGRSEWSTGRHHREEARPAEPAVPPPVFTDRQRQVILLIAEGRSTKQIARALGISPKTVESHRAEIHRKLGDGDIASLTRLAIRAGWVAP